MPSSGKAWFHVTLGTYASWLRGDPRGFRTRDDLHSSGDHRNPPPPGEHAGLYDRDRKAIGQPTVLDVDQRRLVGEFAVAAAERLGHRLLAAAVGSKHVHLLIELPVTFGEADHEIGRLKQSVALKMRGRIHGKRLWAKSCGIKPITDEAHHRRTYAYILRHRDENAWVWCYKDAG